MSDAGRPTLKTADIYFLRCPVTGDVRYVGKANDAQKRLATHLRDSTRRDTPVYRWIRKLTASGQLPIVEIACVVPADDWKWSEIELIASLRASGARLLNVADGGDQPSQTEEQRANAGRAAVRARVKTPLARRVNRLKHLMGVLLRDGHVREDTKAKLRLAAARCPTLFGEYSTI